MESINIWLRKGAHYYFRQLLDTLYLDALPDVSALFVVVLVSEALPPVAKVGGDHEDVRRVGHVPREDATVLDLQL